VVGRFGRRHARRGPLVAGEPHRPQPVVDHVGTHLRVRVREGNYNEVTLIEFVRELRTHFRGEQVILLGDGLPSHRSRLMQQFLAEQKDWLEVRRLPGYAPS